jgi:hypothetical protein
MDNSFEYIIPIQKSLIEIFKHPANKQLQDDFIEQYSNLPIELSIHSKYLNPVSLDFSISYKTYFNNKFEAINFLKKEYELLNKENDSSYVDKIKRIIQNIDFYYTKRKYEFWLFELDIKYINDEISLEFQCITNCFTFHQTLIKIDNKIK